MIFNSVEYFLFLTLVLLLYNRLLHRSQNLMLLAASYIFYGAWDARFLLLIALSTVVDYCAGLWIAHARQQKLPRQMQLGLALSLSVNLGILGFFKYFNFFIDSAVLVLNSWGVSATPSTLAIILPVGISFYTFQTISYTIDIYRGKLEPLHNIVDFALFVAFFPQLVAGPIERATNLLTQIQQPRQVTFEHYRHGFYLILMGLVRKVAIADIAGVIANRYFEHPERYSTIELAAGLMLFGLQIYGDFSGYSNIARGSAQLLGFRLMRNFEHPYFAVNPSDFWRRWHISLSTWLRDYLYIPLGGNRKGLLRTQYNLMITMLLGGLWHGASWNFVIWGFLHGLYLIIFRIVQRLTWQRTSILNHHLEKPIGMLSTFILVTFTWLFFRATDFSTTILYLQGLMQFDVGNGLVLLPLLILIILVLLIDLPQALTHDEYCFLHLPLIPRAASTTIAILLLIFMEGASEPFIYFQF